MASIIITGTGAPLDFAVGAGVGLEASPVGAASYFWELLDAPEGSAASISTPSAATASFTADIAGTYLIQLTVDGDVVKAVAAAPLVVPAPYGSIRPPAAGESLEASLTKGWAREIQKAFALLAEIAQGGGTPAVAAELTIYEGGTPLVKVVAKAAGEEGNDIYIAAGDDWILSVVIDTVVLDRAASPDRIYHKEAGGGESATLNLSADYDGRVIASILGFPSGGEYPVTVGGIDTVASEWRIWWFDGGTGTWVENGTNEIDISGIHALGALSKVGLLALFGSLYIAWTDIDIFGWDWSSDKAPVPGVLDFQETWATSLGGTPDIVAAFLDFEIGAPGGPDGAWVIDGASDTLYKLAFSGPSVVPLTKVITYDLSAVLSGNSVVSGFVDIFNHEVWICVPGLTPTVLHFALPTADGALSPGEVLGTFDPGAGDRIGMGIASLVTGAYIEVDGTLIGGSVDLYAAADTDTVADDINADGSAVVTAQKLNNSAHPDVVNPAIPLVGGAGAGTVSTQFKFDGGWFAALTTTGDGDQALAETVPASPANGGVIMVMVNGTSYEVATSGSKDTACYFSGDGGTTARAYGAIVAGDTLHWMGSIAGFQLNSATHRVALYLHYEV